MNPTLWKKCLDKLEGELTAQQAPSRLQSLRVSPAKSAATKAHWITGGTVA